MSFAKDYLLVFTANHPSLGSKRGCVAGKARHDPNEIIRVLPHCFLLLPALVPRSPIHIADCVTVDGTTTSSSWSSASASYGHLSSGVHTLKLGGWLNLASAHASGKSFNVRIDNVVVAVLPGIESE